MIDLYQRSIDIILENQSPTGAYPASPNFPTYRYCWFRDGAFIAYAMNVAGEHESAHRFHDWAAAAINQRRDLVQRALVKVQQNEPLQAADILDTRFTVEGKTGAEAWPNFQLDGLGTWLWALREHQQMSGRAMPDEWLSASNLTADYLTALWERPCFDCWEEFPDKVHPHTLAAVYGGLQAHASFSGTDHDLTLSLIKQLLFQKGVSDGRFVKYLGNSEVDASLLGLALPYRVVPLDDPLMLATVARIEMDLREGGGVHRYLADTYYGGGAWLLLTAWLGWYYTEIGEYEKAGRAKAWIDSQADDAGNMPEQVPVGLNDPACYDPWRERWGENASPLLWSHAKYIILVANIAGKIPRS